MPTATFPRDPRLHYAHYARSWTHPMPLIPEAAEHTLITSVRFASNAQTQRSLSALLLGVTAEQAHMVAAVFNSDTAASPDAELADLCKRIATVLVTNDTPPPTVTVTSQTITFAPAAPTTPPSQVYALWTTPGDIFSQLEAETRTRARSPPPLPRALPPRRHRSVAVQACGSPVAEGALVAPAAARPGGYVFDRRFRYRTRRERAAAGVGEGDPFCEGAGAEMVQRRLAFFGKGGERRAPASRIPRPVRCVSAGAGELCRAGAEGGGAGRTPMRRGASL